MDYVEIMVIDGHDLQNLIEWLDPEDQIILQYTKGGKYRIILIGNILSDEDAKEHFPDAYIMSYLSN